ncbi:MULTISPECIES: ABC transporter ATP-binding protein [Cetobacterium]|uniref:ATP-binding cassette domain-containing protein n=1 Tax=Candidatus Cetobacterium colombiensis TaxID=3073100 RepID=A0ABU4W7M5_9FUSO|nr:ATP-binding cassette domain-containing protein [Candidatus Cetobacterium colombiensis]MDX8335239.1 ATP-binding cassette domain-containing protein [Candidatus Cetobacterium colombiensis]
MQLRANNISYSHIPNGKNIFENLSFTINSGERIAITAPSGYGKTTLCKILSGYEKPKSGEVFLDNTYLYKYRGYCPVQMIWQHPEQVLNPRLRMKQILKEAGEIDEDLLKSLGIQEKWLNRFPRELSGGELQRFCIARVLNKKTKFLLADEITTMFDLITQSQMWKVILEFCEKENIGIIIISHSQPLIDLVCTKQIFLKDLVQIEHK